MARSFGGVTSSNLVRFSSGICVLAIAASVSGLTTLVMGCVPTFAQGAVTYLDQGWTRRAHAAGLEAAARRGGLMKSPHGWKRPFDAPVPLLRGRQLVTLKDAANYIQKLPLAKSNRSFTSLATSTIPACSNHPARRRTS